MYTRYAERQGFQVETVSAQPADQGGYREVILRILGEGAYSRFNLNRVCIVFSVCLKQRRRSHSHLSTCTVAVLPEVAEIDEVKIAPNELRIDTFRASGAVGSMCRKQIRRSGSLICRRALWWNARMNVPSIKNRYARAMSLLSVKIALPENEPVSSRRRQNATQSGWHRRSFRANTNV